ncbi:MAG TPA: hypothetical protein VII31_10455 [Caldimonas sp.]
MAGAVTVSLDDGVAVVDGVVCGMLDEVLLPVAAGVLIVLLVAEVVFGGAVFDGSFVACA